MGGGHSGTLTSLQAEEVVFFSPVPYLKKRSRNCRWPEQQVKAWLVSAVSHSAGETPVVRRPFYSP